MKELLIVIFLSSITSFHVYSQNRIGFAYDNAGNRINRKVIPLTKSAVAEVNFCAEILSEKAIKIYSNPTKGLLKIEVPDFDKIKSGSLFIYSLQGKLIKTQKMNNLVTDIDISSSSLGVYIVRINIDNETSSWKIIKE